MTFDEIVAMVCGDLNITQPLSIVRVGTHVNRRYRKIMRRLGLNLFSRVEVDFDCVPGTNTQFIPDDSDPIITRIINIFYQADPTTRARMLAKIEYDEMLRIIPSHDGPRRWCMKRLGAENSAVFMIDSDVPDGLTLILECEESKSTLADDDIPNFSEEFHELLVVGAKADELLKMEKPTLAREFKNQFEEDLNELALKAVIGGAQDIVQNAHPNRRPWQRI